MWVTKAKRIFVDLAMRETSARTETPLTDNELARLRHVLDVDPLFRRRFDADPVAAAEVAGMYDLAAALEQEVHELVALAERVARDSVLRAELSRDPVATLVAAGFPEAAGTKLLTALDRQAEADALVPEVVAHHHQSPPLRSQLLIVLLGSTSVTDKIHGALRDA